MCVWDTFVRDILLREIIIAVSVVHLWQLS